MSAPGAPRSPACRGAASSADAATTTPTPANANVPRTSDLRTSECDCIRKTPEFVEVDEQARPPLPRFPSGVAPAFACTEERGVGRPPRDDLAPSLTLPQRPHCTN